jgi:hypothetical protein
MPKRKRRSWRLTADDVEVIQGLKVTYTASGTIPRPVKLPLAEAVDSDLHRARRLYGDRAIARFLRERCKAAMGPEYTAERGFEAIAKQMGMGMSATSVMWLLKRSARESAKRNKIG